ncbi:hypothetical protein KQI68_07230 [Peptoniphilus sp. MSJ-1]|uniref:Beta sliding clamp n=1 Tax=Peptoniphilus ovalis TaxID=2841503 RepID=A0ABS6FK30_9FIRM|nr:hypothetical protein [Peptoniphilus ovalis]MBU5669631.1 hypothetical protein [Peptoniphilus ovalis]
MKLNTKNLQEAINVLNKNISNYAVFNIDDENLILECDTDFIYTSNSNVELKDYSSYMISLDKLKKITKVLDSKEIELEFKEKNNKTDLIINDNGVEISEIVEKQENEINIKKYENYLRLDAEEFIKILKDSKKFRSKDKCRILFTGQLLKYHNNSNTLDVVALDGYKIYVYTIEDVNTNINQDFELILNQKTIERLMKNKNSKEIEIQINFKENEIEDTVIKLNNMFLYDNHTSGDYFNYKSTLRDEYDSEYVTKIDSKMISKYIKYIDKCLKLQDKDQGGKVRPSMITSEIVDNQRIFKLKDNSTKVELKEKSDAKDRFKIAFNGEYLKDLLELFKNEDDVIVTMKNDVNPMILQKDNLLALLLPVRLI